MAGNIYPLHLLYTTNYRLPGDVDRSNLERHMADADFEVYDYSYFYIKTNTNKIFYNVFIGIYNSLQFIIILDCFPDDAWGILYDTTLEAMRNQASSQPLLNIVKNKEKIKKSIVFKCINPYIHSHKFLSNTEPPCINFILFHQNINTLFPVIQ